MPKFKLLQRRDMPFMAEKPGETIAIDWFDHVADIEATGLEDAYDLTQNGNDRFWDPEQSPMEQANYTLTWTRDHRVTLTEAGHRLKHPEANDSLRSFSVGDVMIDEDGNISMVSGVGFVPLVVWDAFYVVQEVAS